MKTEKICIKSSKELKNLIKGMDNNDGSNEYFYYYFYDAKLGISLHKPSGYREVTLKEFKSLLPKLCVLS
jgi:hypothetical protein